MTLNEIVYSIFDRVKPYLTDDSELTEELIAHDIIAERADLIKKSLKGNAMYDDALVQEICCLELEEVDASTCPDVTVGCNVLRTILELPQEILFTRIGPINFTKKGFTIVPYEQSHFSGNGRFNNKEIFAYSRNNHLYLFSKDPNLFLLEKINVRGIFENPAALSGYDNCNSNEPCYTEDSQYPMPAWMEKWIKEYLFKTYVSRYNIPISEANDAQDKPMMNGN